VDDPAKHKSARVVITAVGTDEWAYANNEFSVYFYGETALSFVRQPEIPPCRRARMWPSPWR